MTYTVIAQAGASYTDSEHARWHRARTEAERRAQRSPHVLLLASLDDGEPARVVAVWNKGVRHV